MNGSDEMPSDGSNSTVAEGEETPSDEKEIDTGLLLGVLLPPLVIVLAFILEDVFGRRFVPEIVFMIFLYFSYLISILSLRADIQLTETRLIQRVGYVTIGVHVLSVLTFTHAFVLSEGLGSIVFALSYIPIWILSALTPVSYVVMRVALSRRARENQTEALEHDQSTDETSDDRGPSNLWFVGVLSPIIVSLLVHIPVGLPKETILNLIPLIYLIALLSLIAHIRNFRSTKTMAVASVAGLLLALVTVLTSVVADHIYSDVVLVSISDYNVYHPALIWLILIHLSSVSVIAYYWEHRTAGPEELWNRVTSEEN